MNGWIRLHRSLEDHWIFQDEKKLKWWITILLEVNYLERKILIGNRLCECKRGESIKSLRSWAKKFNTTPETVRYFFKLLQKDKMITVESIGVSTHLRVCNYDTYQSELDTNKTPSDTGSDSRIGHALSTNNNIKKEKKKRINKKFVPPLIEEVILYFDEKGYTREAAVRAFEYYHTGNWTDVTGKQVKNWKQKMIGVWFIEKNKKKVRVLA